MDKLIVVGPSTPKSLYSNYRVINTTSRSETRSRELSPFLVGPIPLYNNYVSKNMENAWQYSKVYPGFGDENGPFDIYFDWAKKGWNKQYADRYPMGRNKIPLYCYWGSSKHLGYIEAKKRIYVPLYAQAVQKTEAFKILAAIVAKNINIALWDFDGYCHESKNMSLSDVAKSTTLKMGHAFVLFALLKNKLNELTI